MSPKHEKSYRYFFHPTSKNVSRKRNKKFNLLKGINKVPYSVLPPSKVNNNKVIFSNKIRSKSIFEISDSKWRSHPTLKNFSTFKHLSRDLGKENNPVSSRLNKTFPLEGVSRSIRSKSDHNFNYQNNYLVYSGKSRTPNRSKNDIKKSRSRKKAHFYGKIHEKNGKDKDHYLYENNEKDKDQHLYKINRYNGFESDSFPFESYKQFTKPGENTIQREHIGGNKREDVYSGSDENEDKTYEYEDNKGESSVYENNLFPLENERLSSEPRISATNEEQNLGEEKQEFVNSELENDTGLDNEYKYSEKENYDFKGDIIITNSVTNAAFSNINVSINKELSLFPLELKARDNDANFENRRSLSVSEEKRSYSPLIFAHDSNSKTHKGIPAEVPVTDKDELLIKTVTTGMFQYLSNKYFITHNNFSSFQSEATDTINNLTTFSQAANVFRNVFSVPNGNIKEQESPDTHQYDKKSRLVPVNLKQNKTRESIATFGDTTLDVKEQRVGNKEYTIGFFASLLTVFFIVVILASVSHYKHKRNKQTADFPFRKNRLTLLTGSKDEQKKLLDDLNRSSYRRDFIVPDIPDDGG